jgi:hypothetical protein
MDCEPFSTDTFCHLPLGKTPHPKPKTEGLRCLGYRIQLIDGCRWARPIGRIAVTGSGKSFCFKTISAPAEMIL